MWFWRVVLFLTFTLVAVPSEFHVRWWMDWQKNGHGVSEAVQAQLVSGALFFYSVIIVVEALVRLEMHPGLAVRPEIRALRYCAALLLIPFVGFLINGVQTPLASTGIEVQWFTAFLSLVLATIVHTYISQVETIRKEA